MAKLDMKELSRRKFLAATGGVGAAAVVLAACSSDGGDTSTTAESSDTTRTTATQTTQTTMAQDTSACDEVKEVVFAGRETMQVSIADAAGPVLAEACAELVLAGFGMDQLQTKTLQAAATGTYIADLIQLAANDAGDVMGQGFLQEVPNSVRDAIAWDDIIPLYRERLTAWDGKVQSVVFDGDKIMQAFRGDLAEDPAHQAAFEEQFGYPLPVAGAETWDQRRDLAKYFKETDWRGDGSGVGLSDMTDRNGFGWYQFFARAASTVKHPELAGAMFHPDTMAPLINNDGYIKVLEEWRDEVLAYGPEGQENWGIGDAFNAFHDSSSFSLVNWVGSNQVNGEWATYPLEDVRFSPTPGSTEVFNYETGQFDTISEVSRSPFIANGGWTFAVPNNSNSPEEAWLAVAAISNPETSLQLVTGATGLEPYRFSHVESTDPWVNGVVPMSQETAETYIEAEKFSMSHPNILVDLRIPGFSQYKDALELAISKVMSGQASAADALNEAAAAWEGVTDNLGGAGVQGELYRQAIA